MPLRPASRSALLVCLCAMSLASPATSAEWRWTAERVVDQRRLTSVEISPDGSQVAYALTRHRAEGEELGAAHADVWVVPFEGGQPRRLTSADAEHKALAWSPDGSRIAFLAARGPEKPDKPKTRVWILPVEGGEATPVTDERTDVSSFAWAPHGRSIAYVAADAKSDKVKADEKAGRDWTVVDKDMRPRRLWIVDVSGPTAAAPRLVEAAGDRSIWEFDWSPDARFMAATVTDTPRTDDSYMLKRVLVLPLGDGQPRELVGVVGKVDQIAWSKDGKSIAYRAGVDESDPSPGSVFVVAAGPGASRPANLTGDRPESVSWIGWVETGRLGAVVSRGTRTALAGMDTRDPSRTTDLLDPGAEVFTAASFSRSGLRFAMAASTSEGPAEVYAGEPARGRGRLRRLTSLNPGLDGLPRGKQEVIRYKARDGVDLEAILIRPASYPGRSSYPLIVIAHGGPESHYRDGWNTSHGLPGQAFAERGHFVVYPNYRGSTGRGVAFSKADHKDLGGREFDDVLDALEAVASAFPIDRKRVGITGGSYGGYFTALGVTRHSRHFAAGAAMFGISNWISFMGTSDIPAENAQVHWSLWCYEHHDLCWQASPLAHVQDAATPTLILQGDKDDRVPKSQSDELYAALKWKGVPVEYVIFPREKHGFAERAHQLETFERIVAWFDKHLRP